MIAFWEGISYVLLVFVAMPLKYFADMPMAVRVVGMGHGVLFIGYVALLAWAAYVCRWPLARSAVAFAVSLVPFGTFWQDPRLKQLEERG